MSNIEWTGETWNPVIGCRRVSEGCRNCYAEVMAGRIALMGGPAGERYSKVVKPGTRQWNGEAIFVPSALDKPLRWRKPRRIFVNSMSDLFHEDVTNEQIAAVFGAMAACPQHTFQVLTKRPERMVEWFEWVGGTGRWFVDTQQPWPLPNVWLGVSVEDQPTADERIPLLLQTPAAVRFVSAEPLLGPVDLRGLPFGPLGSRILDALTAGCKSDTPWHLNWVIVGGESGPGARACDIGWVRSIVEQCRGADVACFVKQLGGHPVAEVARCAVCGDDVPYTSGFADRDHGHGVLARNTEWGVSRITLRDRKGGNPDEWPTGLRVREFPE